MSDHLAVLTGFHAQLDALRADHVRRRGRIAMSLGAAALVAALPLGVAVQHMALALTMIVALIAGAPIHRMPGFRIGLAFVAWQMISIALTMACGYEGQPQNKYGLMYIWLAVPLGLIAFHQASVRRWAFMGVSVTVTLSGLLAAGQFFIGHGDGKVCFGIDPAGPRFEHGVGFAPIHLTQGYIMALLALLFMYQHTVVGGLPRVQQAWVSGVALAAMLLSKARCAIITLPLGIAAVLAARGGRWLLIAIPSLALTLAVTLGSLWLIAPDRVTSMMSGNDGRWPIWRVSAVVISEHPLLGCGGANAYAASYRRLYPVLNPTIRDETRGGGHAHAHNSLLTIACEHGLPALLLFLAFLGALLWAGWQMRRVEPMRWRLSLGVVALALSAGMFENLAAHTAPAYATWMALVLALSAGGQGALAGGTTMPNPDARADSRPDPA